MGQRLTFIVPPSVYTRAMVKDSSVSAPFEGVASVVNVLRSYSKNLTVRCYDLRGQSDPGDALTAALSSDCVCLVGSPDGYPFVKGFAAQIRRIEHQRGLRRVPIILGGPLATVSWATVLEKTAVDFCVLGEAERSFLEFLRRLENGCDPDDLPVAWRNSNGEVIRGRGKLSDWLPDVATLPCPDYTPWIESHGALMFGTACYSTQRGCPFDCGFCANPNGHRTRFVPIEKVEMDLQQIKQQGFKSICINDPTFNTKPDRCEQIARILKKLELPWVCLVRAKPVSETLFKTFRQCGCTAVGVGVESVTESILEHALKGITIKDIDKCLKSAEAARLPITGFCILGLPRETKHSLDRLKVFVRSHSFTPRAFYAVPFPGTDLYSQYRLATKEPGLSEADFEERVLLRMAMLKHDGTDEPFDLPGRSANRKDIISCMNWMLNRAGQDGKILIKTDQLTA